MDRSDINLPLEQITLNDWPFRLLGIAYGQGNRLQLEVVYSEIDRSPAPTQLRTAWRNRQNRRGVPLLVIVLCSEKAYVCGPSGDDPTVYSELDPGQVERICSEALQQPSRQAALRSLRDSLGALGQEGLPGLRNEGFLASHELSEGVPKRADWSASNDKAKRILHSTGKDLLNALGYTVEPLDNVTNILRCQEHKTAVAVLLNDHETPEIGSERIPGSMSPVSYALARADDENLDWVILQHGRKIRLYPVKMGIGVGRRGRTETYLECHTGLIPDDQAAYLWLLFSSDALSRDGSLTSILSDSSDFAGDLAAKLRERIYDEVIPLLAEGLADAQGLESPSSQELTDTYQMAMRVLFRLLFVAYGEDKDLLPYRFNGLYQKRSLKAKAKELVTIQPDRFDESDNLWMEVKSIFRAVDKGNRDWGIPAYNGGLFSSDPTESPVGAKLDELTLINRVFGPVLQQLLLVPTTEGVLGPVDFRSLGVREFGTIYEGLLESELSVAETDLTIDAIGKNAETYRPCKEGETPVVPRGKVYLHNSSGARKSTGSYYTQHFAVEYLLDQSLEPALDDHFARLDELDEVDAAESFFDFRVADIAMGSAHFLVAAVDRIEARYSRYLSKRPLPGVVKELNHQRSAAIEALGDAAETYPDLEDNALLRRLIARRCIYGVDINEVAVQLARLAIWIHTFIPGLPLSLLDRNLVHGNSLVGVGMLSEIEDKARDEGLAMFQANAADFVGDASEALSRLAHLADATRAEVQAARRAWQEADAAIAPTTALCDLLTVARIEGTELPFNFSWWEEEKTRVVDSPAHLHARDVLTEQNPLHFPSTFPEVFLRDRSGFDVLLGNPPWEEATLEEDAFWGRFVPGLRGLSQREQVPQIKALRDDRPDLFAIYKKELEEAEVSRNALVKGPFPGMGTGDPDLYKAFCWRFWQLAAPNGGRIGVVLPRSALSAKGSELFRREVFKSSDLVTVTTLLNTSRWAFDMEPRYTVGLVGMCRSESAESSTITIRGPFNSLESFKSGMETKGSVFTGDDLLSWNDTASLPMLPSEYAINVFAQLRKAPRLDANIQGEWRVRPHTELHATNDKKDKKTGQILMDLESETCPEGYWPIYKGESFDLWQPDTGTYYAWGDPQVILPRLQAKRMKGCRSVKSVFRECDVVWCNNPDTLPPLHHRIVFRDITRATDTRTVRCALIPGGVFCANQAPYLTSIRGDMADTAYLLGVLSSIPLDWYARRYVETHLNYFVLNPLPIPRPESDSMLRQRVIELAGRLASIDDRYELWADAINVDHGPLPEETKTHFIYELDAVVAHLYGLSQRQLTHIYETFHEGWNYKHQMEETLKYFRTWADKL